jgi:hypothetical protein
MPAPPLPHSRAPPLSAVEPPRPRVRPRALDFSTAHTRELVRPGSSRASHRTLTAADRRGRAAREREREQPARTKHMDGGQGGMRRSRNVGHALRAHGSPGLEAHRKFKHWIAEETRATRARSDFWSCGNTPRAPAPVLAQLDGRVLGGAVSSAATGSSAGSWSASVCLPLPTYLSIHVHVRCHERYDELEIGDVWDDLGHGLVVDTMVGVCAGVELVVVVDDCGVRALGPGRAPAGTKVAAQAVGRPSPGSGVHRTTPPRR